MKRNRVIKGIIALLLAASTLFMTTSVYAANNMAFSAGKGYGDLDVSQATLACYSSYASMGYNSNYSTSGANYSVLSGKFSNGTKRLESDIVFLTGHGMWDRIETTATGGLKIGSKSGNKFVGTNDFNWGKVKLAVFLACETGKETSNANVNLAYTVFKKSNWTTTSIGWRDTIYSNPAIQWMKNFNSKLESGATVSSALNYANSKSYSNNTIKNLAFYGNQNLVLKKTKSTVNNADIDESNITYINDEVKFDGKNIKTVTNLLEKMYKDFNAEDYEVDIFTNSKEDNYYTIDFTYKINDIYTNSSYTVIVNNGRVIQVADNSIPENYKVINQEFKDYKTQEKIAKAIGISKTYKNNNEYYLSNNKQIVPISIRKQKTRKFIDLNTNKKYIQVETVYSYKDSNSIAVSSYDYEI